MNKNTANVSANLQMKYKFKLKIFVNCQELVHGLVKKRKVSKLEFKKSHYY